jgi:hypothetical protein
LLSEYPFTNIKCFTESFKDGGLTYSQVDCMYINALKKRSEKMKFLAAIQGIDISGKSGEKPISREEVPEGIENPREFVFGDPDAYDKMSEKEKEELTQKMMGNWASFTKGGGIGGKNG